jgi:hypothetical protein
MGGSRDRRYAPAQGDPYTIPGFTEVERGVIKRAVSALLCARSTGVHIEGIEDMSKFKEALIHRHPGLRGTLRLLMRPRPKRSPARI